MARMSMSAYKRKLTWFSKFMPFIVKGGLKKSAKMVAGEMRKNLSGRVLSRQTGELYKAVDEEVSLRPLRARVFIAPRQQYKAQAHEYGMTVFPKKGKYLVFRIGDKFIKTPSVRIPRRPFAKPALERRRRDVLRILRRTLVGAYSRGKQ
jgi:hypothetical protein